MITFTYLQDVTIV